jgi:putative MFS transporter
MLSPIRITGLPGGAHGNRQDTAEDHSAAGSPRTVPREPLTPFHLRVTATTFGANFSDGYALGVIGAVMPALNETMHLSGVWQGLLGAS